MCDCNPKPKPLGRETSKPQPSSLVASAGGSSGGIVHVAADGTRTVYGDLLGARAAVIRQGGSISNS